jgi:hypothetical protein
MSRRVASIVRNGDGFATRLLSRVPPDVAASFTADQVDALRLAFGMRYGEEHLLDIRRIVHLPFGRFYLVLLAGRDWRREGGARLWPMLRDTLALGGLLGLIAIGLRALL